MKSFKFYLFLIYLIFLFARNVYCQCSELIINGSFENAAYNYQQDNEPSTFARIYQINIGGDDNYVQGWQTAQKDAKENIFGSTNTKKVHSPDWFRTDLNLYNLPFHVLKEEWIDPDPYGTNIPTTATAHSGNGYIGMTDAELIEQKIGLEGERTYSLEIYIRPVKVTRGMGAYYSLYNGWSGGAKFRAWIAADNIKYQHDGYEDDCTDDNDLFSTPPGP